MCRPRSFPNPPRINNASATTHQGIPTERHFMRAGYSERCRHLTVYDGSAEPMPILITGSRQSSILITQSSILKPKYSRVGRARKTRTQPGQPIEPLSLQLAYSRLRHHQKNFYERRVSTTSRSSLVAAWRLAN